MGTHLAIQGNLDPTLLLAPWSAIERAATDLLGRIGTRSGHIFNLGHGILPETDPETLGRLVHFVHRQGVKGT